jgi:hypothetical protein
VSQSRPGPPAASGRLVRMFHQAQDEAARTWREYCGAAQRGHIARCEELDRQLAVINQHIHTLAAAINH